MGMPMKRMSNRVLKNENCRHCERSEAIPVLQIQQVADCFVAKIAPRNDQNSGFSTTC
jgi:hypothetical protein